MEGDHHALLIVLSTMRGSSEGKEEEEERVKGSGFPDGMDDFIMVLIAQRHGVSA